MGAPVFAASGSGTAGADLREDDFADAAAGADLVGDTGDYAIHAGGFLGEDALAREEELEERRVDDAGSDDAGERGDDEDQAA